VTLATLDAAKIDAAEQERQIGSIHLDVIAIFFHERSLECPLFQPLHKNRQPIFVPPQRLDAITTLVQEYEQVSREYVLAEFGLHNREQTVEAATHVDVVAVQEDPRMDRDE
jgi:hypothetical protein